MEVTLIQVPQDPISTIYIAARACYSDKKIAELAKEAKEKSEESKLKLIKAVMSSGHLSTTEHVSFTFAIDGMTRIYTQQLVRHRLAAYSQQSQRYVRMHDIIEEIMENAKLDFGDAPEKLESYRLEVTEAIESYNKMVDELIESGMDSEEACEHARLLLPNATPSNILVTMNLREIMHVCNIRMCTRAQKEIRKVFTTLARMIIELFPFLKDYLVPKCKALGYCDEHKSCGMMPKKEVVLTAYQNWKKQNDLQPDKQMV
jgi:thymidylate synthase (FAD)